MKRLGVHRQCREEDIVHFGHGATRMLELHSHFELVKVFSGHEISFIKNYSSSFRFWTSIRSMVCGASSSLFFFSAAEQAAFLVRSGYLLRSFPTRQAPASGC